MAPMTDSADLKPGCASMKAGDVRFRPEAAIENILMYNASGNGRQRSAA